MSIPSQIESVTAITKANIYFDGKVVSHTIITAKGERKTLGLIYPGAYNFGTGAPEIMEIVAGECRVKLKGESNWTSCTAGASFNVPGNSSFDISVESGICEYICSFV
ncbi:MAG TPA: pyrimidine/purine nucleoside phosphorylase [Kiritimatiellia bacterium]|nr:pyrimidine/purine nucleoside phosphorylase [Kiritimatiellia bacterium]